MKVKDVDVGAIVPYERNAKKHPKEQVRQIAESIRQFGFQQPLVLDRDNVIIIGHGRLEAAKKLGLETVPCVYADELSEEEVKKLRLVDNKLNESEWDFDLLKDELEGLDFGDLDIDWGVDLDDEDAPPEEDTPPDPPEEPKAKRGDIYQLGRHRLMCGDSTNAEDVKKLLGGGASRYAPYRPSLRDRSHGRHEGRA